MQITLSALYRYPLKSGQAQVLRHSLVSPEGLALDREWMVATPEGQYITARTHPQLVLVKAEPCDSGITFSAPGMNDIFTPLSAFAMPQQADVWENTFSARSGAQELNHWISAYLEQTAIVMWTGLEPHRRVKNHPDVPIRFVDGYPLLLISEGSLAELNRQARQDFSMLRFRPNLVIRNADAFAEDHWRRIRIGEVIFELVKPCERCVLTIIDPDTAEKSPQQEPLRTLAKFRKFPAGVLFGQNMLARSTGELRLGMAVEIFD
ncbi:MOSC domain-containing protein [Chitinibacter sp. GC72]|uniref:MOSC domain-containing protein n=1 Tax=Chitinibacter sp. GC72 TaxID=1526917 RepID=UPI0012F8A73B|nr:MOSC domain-containing protein [Chitinibacter sp. GC72]